jgi:sigma-B regulation protein RsbU (phosphoserine phosphatase)
MKASSEPLLHEENSRLQRAVQELSVLNDLALAIGGLQSSKEIVQTIIHRSLRAVDAEQGVITLVDESPASAMQTLVRTVDGRNAGKQFHIDQQLLGWMQLHKQALLINAPATDERFKGVQWDSSIRSVLSVPLIVKSKVRGLLTVYNKNRGANFSPEDQRLLAIIGSQSAQILENVRLLESEKALHLMQEDLRVAALIQTNLLPHTRIALGEYDIHGMTIPAQVVGGDYFDYFPISETRMGIALGDVSGKGLPASLLMANVQATLRGQALWAQGAAECIERANRLLFLSTSSDRFVTLFFAVLDARAHTLTYCNAGHEPPILMSASGAGSRLVTGGPLLGVVEDAGYDEKTVPLEPGDTLLVFSDGFSEAMNTMGDQLGEESIVAVLHEHRASEAEAVVSALFQRTETHAGKAPQSDDRTALVVRRRIEHSI